MGSIVVVGVFIGIQVSNWNDARALREREQVYLEQLLIDLESDRATGAQSARNCRLFAVHGRGAATLAG